MNILENPICSKLCETNQYKLGPNNNLLVYLTDVQLILNLENDIVTPELGCLLTLDGYMYHEFHNIVNQKHFDEIIHKAFVSSIRNLIHQGFELPPKPNSYNQKVFDLINQINGNVQNILPIASRGCSVYVVDLHSFVFYLFVLYHQNLLRVLSYKQHGVKTQPIYIHVEDAQFLLTLL